MQLNGECFSSVNKTLDPSPRMKQGKKKERRGHGATVLYSQNSGGRSKNLNRFKVILGYTESLRGQTGLYGTLSKESNTVCLTPVYQQEGEVCVCV